MRKSLEYVLLVSISTLLAFFAHETLDNNDLLLENGSIGIDEIDPDSQLHISRTLGHPDGATINLQHGDAASHLSQNQSGGVMHLYRGNNDSQTLMRSYGNTYINKSVGNVGIGTSTPSSKVEIAGGSLFLSDADGAIILKSPDGSCFRLTVANTGSLSVVGTSCP